MHNDITAGSAGERLRALAAGVRETEPDSAVGRLLERVAARDDAEPLRAALVLEGARAVVRAALEAQR